jgi:hypothetical protein
VVEKLAAHGPLGLTIAVLLLVVGGLSMAVRTLYRDNQEQNRHCVDDAKEYARGLAAGIATLDATQELVTELVKRRGSR